jgi:hypothetical protein
MKLFDIRYDAETRLLCMLRESGTNCVRNAFPVSYAISKPLVVLSVVFTSAWLSRLPVRGNLSRYPGQIKNLFWRWLRRMGRMLREEPGRIESRNG